MSDELGIWSHSHLFYVLDHVDFESCDEDALLDHMFYFQDFVNLCIEDRQKLPANREYCKATYETCVKSIIYLKRLLREKDEYNLEEDRKYRMQLRHGRKRSEIKKTIRAIQNTDKYCAICMTNKSTVSSVKMTCNHTVCRECFDSIKAPMYWGNRYIVHYNCPFCRKYDKKYQSFTLDARDMKPTSSKKSRTSIW